MVYFWSEVGIISEKFANDVKEDLMKYFIPLFFLIISQEIVAGAFAGDTIIYTENGLKQAETKRKLHQAKWSNNDTREQVQVHSSQNGIFS